MMSFGPPAGNGTISRIGLLGKSCAEAIVGNRASAKALTNVRIDFIQTSRAFEPEGIGRDG
jgi:hypothetical protein